MLELDGVRYQERDDYIDDLVRKYLLEIAEDVDGMLAMLEGGITNILVDMQGFIDQIDPQITGGEVETALERLRDVLRDQVDG